MGKQLLALYGEGQCLTQLWGQVFTHSVPIPGREAVKGD